MKEVQIKPGALDEIANMIDAKSDADLAGFLGITEKQLESLRYGAGLDILQAAEIVKRREAHIRAAELLNRPAA
ncbi:hypothetical protein HMPREF0290_0902 [Corynebacterium efficiens YS-314]|uniref:Uncharacterized protein n=1 Tax=Corynebacterium efficiens (strain DSM 44549 / YS-314 / AJ 12310 / JCM 11189 / NBRC 100395) TaxID=196164 RepID=Q8FRD7_COREF|nr:hypothetical protein [Corynebacterium efficiens]EEW50454.1 hypothetical protein HMPREF0290_0902 [Corynebacterium efficiens YS-314]BAC17634.1 hypothetical protein [Corynebacterium efficiens YS-314]